jgi:hypothetical protein
MRRAKKLYLAMGLALAAMLVAAGTVFAAVNFDSNTGTGFAGKGDVQLAFSWNNSQLQKNAKDVTFSYNSTDTYDVTIEFDTGNPDNPRSINHHTVTQDKSTTVDSSVAYDPRVKNQITGFNLKGFGTTTTSGSIPAVGDSCSNGFNCVVTAVEKVSSSGGLYANYGTSSILIWPPAAPVV